MKNFIKSTENFISFIVALIPSVLFWIFEPAKPVPYVFLVVSGFINLLLLWLFLRARYLKLDSAQPPPIQIFDLRDGIFLCHPNILLGQDIFVSFYLKVDKYEKLIGYGYVSNVQSNGIVQITALDTLNTFSIENRNAYSFDNLIVKPNVSINYINQKASERRISTYERN